MGEIREVIRVRWDAVQVGCLTQVGWNSLFHACACMFGTKTAYDLLIDDQGCVNINDN